MRRLAYILWRVASDLGGLASRAANALLFRGSTAQTLSARAHLEAPHSALWRRVRAIINAAFFWEPDHCAADWAREVERARYTLAKLEAAE